MNKLFFNLKTFLYNKNLETTKREIRVMLGQQAIIASRTLYQNLEKLYDAEVKVFSQWGEDGILDYLFTKLGISKPCIVEFGVGEFNECNSRFAAEFRNASVYMADLNKDLVNIVKNTEIYWKNSLFPVIDRITPDNVSVHLDSAKSLMGRVDVLSIDIDGNDYWVLEAADLDSIPVVVCEYNPIYGAEMACTIKRQDSYDRAEGHFSWLHYGMSIRAAVTLMARKGFTFIGSNRAGNNAFFVNNMYVYLVSIPIPDTVTLDEFVDWRVRESRNISGKLDYLGFSDAQKQISQCHIFDLETNTIVTVASTILR